MKFSVRFDLLFVIIYLFCININVVKCGSGSVSFISFERPIMTYYNKKYLCNATVNSRRVSRQDPRYYINLYLDVLMPIDNKIKVDIYIYEFIQPNRFRRSFLEFHHKFCDMIQNDVIFGGPIKRHLDFLNKTCPYPPGKYQFTNMTCPFVPKWMPKFMRGRLYINLTLDTMSTVDLVANGYGDVELKTIKVNNKKQ